MLWPTTQPRSRRPRKNPSKVSGAKGSTRFKLRGPYPVDLCHGLGLSVAWRGQRTEGQPTQERSPIYHCIPIPTRGSPGILRQQRKLSAANERLVVAVNCRALPLKRPIPDMHGSRKQTLAAAAAVTARWSLLKTESGPEYATADSRRETGRRSGPTHEPSGLSGDRAFALRARLLSRLYSKNRYCGFKPLSSPPFMTPVPAGPEKR